MAVEPRLMTAAELERLPDDGQRHELVRGELRTMAPPGFEHGGVTLRCGSSLLIHVDAHQLGKVVTDAGFLLATDPDIVRLPDVAFVTRERADAAGRVRGFWVGAPDLAIEIISPNDLYGEVDEKVADYLEYGTRLVLVANPRRCTVAAHRPGQPVQMYAGDDILQAEDIVPGWKLPLPDLFRQP
ncbi:MAG TPA: Uma2 family endonuclease [Chloroflexota bacterium]|nr:Uma2 family endonuclease [Chloroflexota bacterium]